MLSDLSGVKVANEAYSGLGPMSESKDFQHRRMQRVCVCVCVCVCVWAGDEVRGRMLALHA